MIPNRAPSHRRSGAGRIAVAILLALSGCDTPGSPGALPTDGGASRPADGTATSGTGSLGVAAESSTAKYGVKLDVVEPGGVLRTTEGYTYQLGSDAGYVVRVPAGWLYGHVDGAVNLLRPDGSTLPLAAVVEQAGGDMPAAPVVSADGRQIAWSKGNAVFVGILTSAGITDMRTSPVPTDTYPVTWTGSLVVLAQPYAPGCCGYRKVQYDVWDPARGNFAPQWTREVWPVYGPTPTAPFAIRGTDATGNGCLVQLNGVQDLSVTASACVPGGLKVGSLRGLLAPDGGHLVEGLGDKIQIFDLSTVTTTKEALRTCPGDWPKAWEDNNTVLVENSTTGVVTRCYVDGGAPAPVPGLKLGSRGASSGVALVARIG